VLVFFLCVAVPLRYLGDEPRLSEVISPIHGILLYPLYLVVTVNLAVRRHWSLLRTVGVMLAGTVPFLSFVVERRVTREVPPPGSLHG
jgi:integral membrane protein